MARTSKQVILIQSSWYQLEYSIGRLVLEYMEGVGGGGCKHITGRAAGKIASTSNKYT